MQWLTSFCFKRACVASTGHPYRCMPANLHAQHGHINMYEYVSFSLYTLHRCRKRPTVLPVPSKTYEARSCPARHLQKVLPAPCTSNPTGYICAYMYMCIYTRRYKVHTHVNLQTNFNTHININISTSVNMNMSINMYALQTKTSYDYEVKYENAHEHQCK